MPNRTERRAAERLARKAAQKQDQSTVQTVAAERPELIDPQPEPIVLLPTATEAQINANRANSKLSTGPTSTEGKAIVSQNRRSHGLAGRFMLLPNECAEDLQTLTEGVYNEYQPATDTEQRLADSIIQHYWLMQRALYLQEQLVTQASDPTQVEPQRLGIFMRYQASHERSYYKAQRELQNLQKQRRKTEIGFESQQREQEAHEARTRLTHARAQTLEVDSACRQVMAVPIPGTYNLSLKEIAQACSNAIANTICMKEYLQPLDAAGHQCAAK